MSGIALIIEQKSDKFAGIQVGLTANGFTTVVAQSGHEGIALARSQSPDLVVLDLTLPDLPGPAVCEKLKLCEITNLIPVVMVTSNGEHDDLQRGLRVRADAYLPLPEADRRLRDAIESALAWRRRAIEAGHAAEIRFDLRSDIAYLKQAHAKITELFARTSLSEKEVREMSQAVLEMGMNAIEWGNRGNLDALVNIVYRFDEQKLALIVRDEGPGFDPKNLPHAANDDDPVAHMLVRETLGLREGGFGIMLAKGMVDAVHYNERGNEVTLIKFFSSEPGENGE